MYFCMSTKFMLLASIIVTYKNMPNVDLTLALNQMVIVAILPHVCMLLSVYEIANQRWPLVA